MLDMSAFFIQTLFAGGTVGNSGAIAASRAHSRAYRNRCLERARWLLGCSGVECGSVSLIPHVNIWKPPRLGRPAHRGGTEEIS